LIGFTVTGDKLGCSVARYTKRPLYSFDPLVDVAGITCDCCDSSP